MNTQIDVETLREWLETGRAVTVLDVRKDVDRAEWSVPGSIHVNVYDDLKAARPGTLQSLDLPPGRPVVTICNQGKVSQIAAEQLRTRGFPAWSLAGGMKAWSLAWNTADVPLRDAKAGIVQVRRTGKGCLSYVVGSAGSAAVIDPSLPPDVYLKLAAEQRQTIRYVLETHIHADHLSRAKLLAERTGAELLLPAQERVHFSFTPVTEGDVMRLGSTALKVIATPGHTEESVCYLLEENGLFTGDTLFLSGIGRPDLDATPDEARHRAKLLYGSLLRLLALPPGVQVLPAHTSEPVPFDRAPVSEQLASVACRIEKWMSSEQEFVDSLISRIPPAPPNYVRIVELNEAGGLPEADPTDLEAGANRCAVS